MVSTSDKPSYSNIFDAVPKAVEAIQSLSIDEQLGLLWVIYKNMGGLVTPPASSTTERIKLAGGLIHQIGNLSHEEQLQFMRDLIGRVDNTLTRSYGLLSSNNKLVFWYQLAQCMCSREIIPTPEGYHLSAPATAVLNKVVALEFNQQVAVLRLIVGKMGIDSLTV